MVAAALGLFGERLCLVGRWNPDRARRVDWAHGAVLMVRRAAWDAVDGFDPDVWMYGEDLDLAWRLRRAGFATRYEPRAIVHHAQSAAATQAFGDEKDAREWDAAYEWMVRRRGRPAALGVALVNLLAALRSPRFRALHARGARVALRRGTA
jgi:GT2 family glycosyltransferase